MQISEIHIYPIKSLGGILLKKTMLTSRGLAFDRRFMLTTLDGQFMTQRSNRRMTLLTTTIVGANLIVQNKSHPLSKIEFPLQPAHFSKQQEVTIWKDTCIGQVLHPRINQWFSKQLGQACQLVYMPDNSQRLISSEYRKGNEMVSFADGFPILLFGQAGMDDINKRLETPVSIDRFRANIIYTGGQPFEEDHWSTFKIGNQPFRSTKPCVRCNVPNINQSTGEIDKEKEPNRILATFRKKNSKIYVGMNVCWEGKGRASITVGDELVIGN